MRRVENSDGIAVNIIDWVCLRYAFVVIPLVAVLSWYIPYQDITYTAVANNQEWTYLFPNLRRVLEVPFNDPQRVSGTLVFLDVLFVLWFAFLLPIMPRYTRLILVKGGAERISHYGKWESLKLMAYGVLAVLASGGWVFYYDGKTSWMVGDFFNKYALSFVLSNVVAAWAVAWAYLGLVAVFFNYRSVRK